MPTLRNVTAGVDLSESVTSAPSAINRAIGWLGAGTIAPRDGLWLRPCSAIHTLGMRSAIDVILLDRHSRVVALRPRVRPNRLIVAHRRARSVIEMGPGFLDDAQINLGDELALLDAH